MAVPSFVGVLGPSPEDLPSGKPQTRDRHLKSHEDRDDLGTGGMPWQNREGAARALNLAATVIGL
ncbi:hypothetical protein [Mycobacterium sp.]|uniref:hypothetical protein n=1 Tax=Mycobacterium sp. TaxID=1785 RepID=UPI003F9DE0A9